MVLGGDALEDGTPGSGVGEVIDGVIGRCAEPPGDDGEPPMRLATEKLRRSFGLTLPQWQAGVERMLAEAPQK